MHNAIVTFLAVVLVGSDSVRAHLPTDRTVCSSLRLASYSRRRASEAREPHAMLLS